MKFAPVVLLASFATVTASLRGAADEVPFQRELAPCMGDEVEFEVDIIPNNKNKYNSIEDYGCPGDFESYVGSLLQDSVELDAGVVLNPIDRRGSRQLSWKYRRTYKCTGNTCGSRFGDDDDSDRRLAQGVEKSVAKIMSKKMKSECNGTNGLKPKVSLVKSTCVA